MQARPVSALTPSPSRTHARTVVVASADRSFRQRIAETLTGLRWQVREVEGGAQAWAEAEAAAPEAIIVDSWLPDLEMSEFLKEFRGSFPGVDVVTADGDAELDGPRGPYRQELLYALRRSQDNDTAVWNAAPVLSGPKLQLLCARRRSLRSCPRTPSRPPQQQPVSWVARCRTWVQSPLRERPCQFGLRQTPSIRLHRSPSGFPN